MANITYASLITVGSQGIIFKRIKLYSAHTGIWVHAISSTEYKLERDDGNLVYCVHGCFVKKLARKKFEDWMVWYILYHF